MPEKQQDISELEKNMLDQFQNLIEHQLNLFHAQNYENRLLWQQLHSICAQQDRFQKEMVSGQEKIKTICTEMKEQIDTQNKIFGKSTEKDYENEDLGDLEHLYNLPTDQKKSKHEVSIKEKKKKESNTELKSLSFETNYPQKPGLKGYQHSGSEEIENAIIRAVRILFIQQAERVMALKKDLESEFRLTRRKIKEYHNAHVKKTEKFWEKLNRQLKDSVFQYVEKCFFKVERKMNELLKRQRVDRRDSYIITNSESSSEDDGSRAYSVPSLMSSSEIISEIRQRTPEHKDVEDEGSLTAKYRRFCCWMKPLSYEQYIRFYLKYTYVEPDLQVFHPRLQKGQKTSMEKLFEPVVDGSLPVQRVLLLGEIGSGKSSLCQKSAFGLSLGTTKFNSLPWNTTLHIIFELRNLPRKTDLETELLNLVRSSVSEEILKTGMDLVQYLCHLQRNLVVMLDGFDELEPERQIEAKRFLSLKDETSPFTRSYILVTSRPAAADQEFLDMFDKVVSIAGFSDAKLESFVSGLNKNTCPESKTEKGPKFPQAASYTETQFAEQRILEKTRNPLKLSTMSPLMISLILWVIDSSEFKNSDVIYTCIELLCKRCNEREGFSFTFQQIRDVLWTYGFLSLHSRKFIFSEEELRKALGIGFSLLSLSGIIKRCNQSAVGENLWEPTQNVFVETLTGRVVENTNKEHLHVYELQERLANDFFDRTYSSKVSIHCSKNKTFSAYLIVSSADGKMLFCKWNEETQRMAFSDQENPGFDTVEIELSFWACSWAAIESVYQYMLSIHCARQYFAMLNTFNLREYSDWRPYSIKFSYEDLAEQSLDDVICPGGKSLMSKLGKKETLKELRIHVKNSLNYKCVLLQVMCKLFDVPVYQISENERPGFYFEYLQRLASEEKLYRVTPNVCLKSGISVSDFSYEEQGVEFWWEDIETITFNFSKRLVCRIESS